MNSNSAIFSSSIYGTNSAKTVEEINANILKTKQDYLNQLSIANLRVKLPTVPSNQKTVKGK